MEDRETPQMHKYGESNTTRIMMATVRHDTAWARCTKYQATWFLLKSVPIRDESAVQLLYHVLDPASVTLKLKKHEFKCVQDSFTNMKREEWVKMVYGLSQIWYFTFSPVHIV